MKISVRLDGALLERARQEAARRGTTLASLVEQGLELAMRAPISLPVCKSGGGTLPGVDLNDSSCLLGHLDGED